MSVELSAQHAKRPPERPKILTESRPLSINLNWRTCPSEKPWAQAKVFRPRRKHHVRGEEVDVNSHTYIPATPHVQPQSAWFLELHLPREGSWEAKMTTQRLV